MAFNKTLDIEYREITQKYKKTKEIKDFQQLKDYYNSYDQHKGCFTGSLGKIYDLRNDKLRPFGCFNWNCPKCRPYLKYKLYVETFNICKAFELDKHFIITFQGKKFRDKIPFYQSYQIMSNIWNKYKKVIEYHKGKFEYLIFPRAQKDGYCHFHIILPKYISWYFLEKKRKLYPEMGYLRINKNIDLAEYLHRDFFKDNEYYTPLGQRHYSSSKALTFNQYINPYFREDNILLLGRHKPEDMEKEIIKKFGRLLPFEEYVKKFADIKIN